MDQGSTRKRSAVHNFAPTVTKFCVVWEGQALPHDTKFGNCRCEIVGSRVIFIWSLIHGSSWSGLIKAEPGMRWISDKSEQTKTQVNITKTLGCVAYFQPHTPQQEVLLVDRRGCNWRRIHCTQDDLYLMFSFLSCSAIVIAALTHWPLGYFNENLNN